MQRTANTVLALLSLCAIPVAGVFKFKHHPHLPLHWQLPTPAPLPWLLPGSQECTQAAAEQQEQQQLVTAD
jgi:hypothetical protein